MGKILHLIQFSVAAGHDPRSFLAVVNGVALVPVELLLQTRLSIDRFGQRWDRNLELLAAKRTHSDCRSGA